MKQIFTFGSSSVYGVGGTKGGWADLIKDRLHEKMYGQGGMGEKFEVFNFGKSGATIEFVRSIYPIVLENYGRDIDKMAVVNVGGNNAKAINDPEKFVSTPEDFEVQMREFLSDLKRDFNRVIFVEGGFFDETKTYPKPSPFVDRVSYFSNQRKQLFSDITKKVCAELSIVYVSVETSQEEWIEKYLYDDGLHANDAGYEYILNNLFPEIEDFLKS